MGRFKQWACPSSHHSRLKIWMSFCELFQPVDQDKFPAQIVFPWLENLSPSWNSLQIIAWLHNVFQGCALAKPGGPWGLTFVLRPLKNHMLGTLDFTSSIDALLSYTHFLFSLLYFFFFLINQNFHSVPLNLYGLPYSSRKPIVYKPPASI